MNPTVFQIKDLSKNDFFITRKTCSGAIDLIKRQFLGFEVWPRATHKVSWDYDEKGHLKYVYINGVKRFEVKILNDISLDCVQWG